MQLNTNPKAKQKIKATATELRYLEQALQVAQAASGVALAAKDDELRQLADKAIATTAALAMRLREPNQPDAADPVQEGPSMDQREAVTDAAGQSESSSVPASNVRRTTVRS